MNKRIEELIEQTIASIPQGAYEIPDSFCEKFAELIVKECIEIVNAGINNAEHYWDQACENRAWAIQDHFGVE